MNRCMGCKYRAAANSGYLCDYLSVAGHSRGGSIGECAVRETGERPDRTVSPPITAKAAMEDRARRRAAIGNVRKSRLDQPDAKALYGQGLNDAELARAFGMTRNAVAKWRKKRGLPANAPVGRGTG